MQISCATPVTDGMVVNTQSPNVKAVQDGVLEFLLINHPLDCPVCDRGGECPLQDQTLAFGPGESRFVEEKRHFEKPVPISDLVLLDRERCIQCGRCTRFAAEIAGDPLIDFGERGANTQVITYPDEPFSSYFSGNTVQICPVGALTASAVPLPRPARGTSRRSRRRAPPARCGCRGALQSTSNRIVRLLGVDSEPVNQGWLCDKGRYGYEWVHSEERVRAPMVRKNGELVEVSWPEALDAAAAGLQGALDADGPGIDRGARRRARQQRGRLRLGALRQERARHRQRRRAARRRAPARGRARPSRRHHRRHRPRPRRRARRRPTSGRAPGAPPARATRGGGARRAGDRARARAPPDSRATSPRCCVTRPARRARWPSSSPARSPATAPRRASGSIEKAASALDGRDGDLVVVIGRQSLAESPASVVQAAAALAALPNVKFLSALAPRQRARRARARAHPRLPPRSGHPRRGPPALHRRVGQRPRQASVSTRPASSTPPRPGASGALVLLGAEPEQDFPDRIRMRAGARRGRRS